MPALSFWWQMLSGLHLELDAAFPSYYCFCLLAAWSQNTRLQLCHVLSSARAALRWGPIAAVWGGRAAGHEAGFWRDHVSRKNT